MAGKRDSGEDILREIQRSGGQGNSGKAQQQIAEALAALDAEQQQIKEETKKQKQSILTKKDVKDIFEDLYKKEEEKRDKKLKSTLKQAFKEMYDAEEKKRQATSPTSAVDPQLEQNASQDYKRDINEMRYGISGVGATARENNALLREQINLQTRSISILNDIHQTMKGMGGLGSLLGGLGGVGRGASAAATAAGGVGAARMIGGAVAAAGGVAAHYIDADESKAGNSTIGSWINENIPGAAEVDNFAYEATGGLVGTSKSDPRYSSSVTSVPSSPSSSSSVDNPDKNKTAAVLEAEKKGDKKKNNLSVTADKMSFKADKLSFNVQSLTIDAKSVKKSEISKLENKNVSSTGAPKGSAQQSNAPGGTPGGAPGGAPGSTPGGASSGNVTTPGGSSSGASASAMGGPGGAPPKAAGSSENAKKAVEFFKARGWSAEQAAAIVGNLQAESGKDLNPGAVGDGGKAHGIAQWHPDRRKNFEKVFGKPFAESNFDEQLAFVNWELTNTEKKAGDRLREAKSASEASAIVDKYYERSSGQARAQRDANTTALMSGRDTATTPGAGAGRGSVNEKPGERAAAMAGGPSVGAGAGRGSIVEKPGERAAAMAAAAGTTEVDPQFLGGEDPEVIKEKAAEDNRPWWKKALGITDETIAKTLDLEKNGPVMTAMGDIAAPGGAYVPEAKPDLTVDPKTNILDDIKPRKLEKRMTSKMVDDPNWDRHAQSRKMYEEATARENRGENSQSMYWSAEAQRKKELAMKAPQIKQMVAEKGDFGNPLANIAAYGSIAPELQGTTEVDSQFTGGTDPEVLGEKSIPQVQAIKDASAVRSSGEAMASMREAAPRLAMEDKDREDMYGQNTKLQQAQIEKTATADNLVSAGMAPAKTGRAATPRNMAGAVGGGPEASREKQQSQDADYNNMEVDDKAGNQPSASLSSGDGWLTKFFPYLYGSGDKPSMRVGAD